MNIIPNSTRAANPAAQNFSSYFLQGGAVGLSKDVSTRAARTTSGVSAMSYYGKVRTRVPYANALYAAAVAALLSACAPSDETRAPEASTVEAVEQVAESDLPTVVITAARERPKAIG